jgi:hypothetical protein
MADTGNPWFIPFADPTDLVRDFPALSSAVGTAVAAGLTAANVGIGSNVVQTVKTDTFAIGSGTFTDVTGLAVTITPTSATSKILVMVYVVLSTSGSNNFDRNVQMRLMRDATAVFVGDAAGSRTQATGGWNPSNDVALHTGTAIGYSPVYLDSPATTSAVTYKVQLRSDLGTGVLGRTGIDGDSSRSPRMPSSITAIEVAA